MVLKVLLEVWNIILPLRFCCFGASYCDHQQICYSETKCLENNLVFSIVPVTFTKKKVLNSSHSSSGVNLILVPEFLIGVPLRNAASVSKEKLTHKEMQKMAR